MTNSILQQFEEHRKDGWIPFLRAGTFIDSMGRKNRFDSQKLDEIVSKFGKKDSVFCVEHPENSTPSVGTIDDIKRVGGYLLAKPREIFADFATKLKDKAYRYVSASIAPDLSLNHIGFTNSPLIDGLGQIPETVYANFGDEQNTNLSFEFSQLDTGMVEEKFRDVGDTFAKIKDLILAIVGLNGADNVTRAMSDGVIDFIRDASVTISDEQEYAVKDTNAGDGGQETTDAPGKEEKVDEDKSKNADFAAQLAAEQQRTADLERENKRLKQAEKKREAAEFSGRLNNLGLFTGKKKEMLEALLVSLDDKETPAEFSQFGESKLTQAGMLRGLLSDLKQVPLKPINVPAGGGDSEFASGGDKSEDERIHEATLRIQNANPGMNYKTALAMAKKKEVNNV